MCRAAAHLLLCSLLMLQALLPASATSMGTRVAADSTETAAAAQAARAATPTCHDGVDAAADSPAADVTASSHLVNCGSDCHCSAFCGGALTTASPSPLLEARPATVAAQGSPQPAPAHRLALLRPPDTLSG